MDPVRKAEVAIKIIAFLYDRGAAKLLDGASTGTIAKKINAATQDVAEILKITEIQKGVAGWDL